MCLLFALLVSLPLELIPYLFDIESVQTEHTEKYREILITKQHCSLLMPTADQIEQCNMSSIALKIICAFTLRVQLTIDHNILFCTHGSCH